MLKRLFLFVFVLTVFAAPAALLQTQEAPTRTPRIEITGVNPSGLPTVIVTASVVDTLGQPVRGLGIDDFELSGAFTEFGRVVDVQNITDDQLSFATALVIDVSSSMSGSPIERAKEAAIAFVNAVSDHDPVAIVSFSNRAVVVQPPITDKQTLINAINALPFGGETALYDAGVLGIETASISELPRRAVVILSDGAEFGGNSANTRAAAQERALALGVPVYTIGLGFGADRSYLESLANATNGQFFESPTPEELPQIFADLAALFRSQYVITLEADIPADGTEYAFGLKATTPQGETNIAESMVRAPIPVPIVRAPDAPAEPITELTTFTFEVVADDPLTNVSIQIGEFTADLSGESPYQIQFDPFTQAPGDYTLTLTAQDETGDTGSGSVAFTVPPIPANVSLDVDLASLGEIAAPVTFTVQSEGQTATQSVRALVDGEEIGIVEGDAPATFTLDPNTLAPGQRTLTVEVTSASGAVATVDQGFSIAALPPVIRLDGFEEGQNLLAPTTATLQIENSQTAIESVVFTAGDVTVTYGGGEAPYTFDLEPEFYQPGLPVTLTAVVTNEGGQSAQVTRNFFFDVSLYPTPTPTIDAAATDSAATQAAFVNATGTAFSIEVATQDAVATESMNATVTVLAELSAEETAVAQETEAMITATADAALLATSDALSTQSAEVTAVVRETTEAEIRALATLDEQARATNIAAATVTAEARAATVTANFRAATREFEISQTSTAEAEAEATAAIQQETETALVNATATVEAEATLAEETLVAANLNATATDAALQVAALNAQATEDANATESADDEERQTREFELTNARVGTSEAQETATADALLVLSVTPEPTEEPTEAFDPTVTPSGVTEVEAEGAPGLPFDTNTILICGGLLLIGLIVLFVLLSRRRREP